MNIIYRKAMLFDLKDIQKLNFELCKKEFKEFDKTINVHFPLDKHGTHYFKKRITDKDGFAFVALDNGQVVGYSTGGIAKAEDYRIIKNIGEAESMMVKEEYRNQGIGSRFLAEFFKWCKLKKVKRIRAVVSAKNMQSVTFHKKNGFSEYNIVLEKSI